MPSSFKAFATSAATCTGRDRELETEINRRLDGRGKVSAYTITDGADTRYGLTYSHGVRHKTFERARFEMDVDGLLRGLDYTASGMENAGIPRGWVYDVEEADAEPDLEQ